VTYFDRVLSAYRDVMMTMGVSEDVVNYCLFAFETGFNAGTLRNGDVNLQQKMVATILNENNLN
jgi:hypothetical protein